MNMQGLTPSLNTVTPSPQLLLPTQTSRMNDFAARLEQQKLMLRRAQLVASAEQGVQSKPQPQPQPQCLAGLLEPAIPFHYSAVNGGANSNGGMDALLRHKALLNGSNAEPTRTNANNLGLPVAALDAIDVKNGFVHLGCQQGLATQLRQNSMFAANQAMALNRLNNGLGLQGGTSLSLSVPSPPPPALGGGLFQNVQVAAPVPSAAASPGVGGAVVNGNSLLARHLALQQQMQQNAQRPETTAPPAAAAGSNNSPPVVPPSLAHLQPQPLKKKSTVKRKKKPADKPKRPLSAYNLFFRDERARILESIPTPAGYGKKKKSKKNKGLKQAEEEPSQQDDIKRRMAPHGKIGFENLAKIIGKRWQDLSEKEAAPYKVRAEREMDVYRKKMEEWAAKQEGASGKGKGGGDGGKKKKRKILVEDETDADLFASLQKKVKQLDANTSLLSAPASCF